MLDYMRLGDHGAAYIDFNDLTRDQAAAIQEITVDEYMVGSGEAAREVRKTKFKLADKRGALELLARHHKLLTDKLEVSADDELLKVLAEGRQNAAAHAG
jgi:phage terminase small subunit